MSGHSKWATTKRAKAIVDAKRSAVFTRLANLITIAAREKGGDPATNFSLRMAIDKAKQANMPKDNIERSIKRGTGELQGAQIEELYYNGVGPLGAQYIIKSLTDSRNRSASSIRHIFSKFGGSLGSVMWNFSKNGIIRIASEELKKINFDELELELIDAGAEDIKKEEEGITIISKVEDLQKVKKFLEEKNMVTESAEIEFIAKEEMSVAESDREKIEKFENELEDSEDVTDFYSNVA
jgi:YebC/PmpR family DNA-binding regulatory protein